MAPIIRICRRAAIAPSVGNNYNLHSTPKTQATTVTVTSTPEPNKGYPAAAKVEPSYGYPAATVEPSYAYPAATGYSGGGGGSADRKGIAGRVFGGIQVVDSFEDYKVKVVDAFADLHVRCMDAFADGPGMWKFVDAFPDYKIRFVDAFEDFSIKYVDAFEGVQ